MESTRMPTKNAGLLCMDFGEHRLASIHRKMNQLLDMTVLGDNFVIQRLREEFSRMRPTRCPFDPTTRWLHFLHLNCLSIWNIKFLFLPHRSRMDVWELWPLFGQKRTSAYLISARLALTACMSVSRWQDKTRTENRRKLKCAGKSRSARSWSTGPDLKGPGTHTMSTIADTDRATRNLPLFRFRSCLFHEDLASTSDPSNVEPQGNGTQN